MAKKFTTEEIKKIISEKKTDLPELIENTLKCINPTCITNQPREPITPKFRVISKAPLLIRCDYCGRYLRQEDVIKQV